VSKKVGKSYTVPTTGTMDGRQKTLHILALDALAGCGRLKALNRYRRSGLSG